MSSSCKVCAMKRAGLAPPKRKCSCDSGITVQRDRKSACAPAANERSSDPLGFGDGLQDRDEPNSYQEIELVGGRLRPRLGDASSRDGGHAAARFRAALSRCAFGRGQPATAPTDAAAAVVFASVAPEPRRMCMYHTWGGRPKPDACVRSPRARARQASRAPRAFGRIVARAHRLSRYRCAYHIAARTSTRMGLCRLSVVCTLRHVTPRPCGFSCVIARGLLHRATRACASALSWSACYVQRALPHVTVWPALRHVSCNACCFTRQLGRYCGRLCVTVSLTEPLGRNAAAHVFRVLVCCWPQRNVRTAQASSAARLVSRNCVAKYSSAARAACPCKPCCSRISWPHVGCRY